VGDFMFIDLLLRSICYEQKIQTPEIFDVAKTVLAAAFIFKRTHYSRYLIFIFGSD